MDFVDCICATNLQSFSLIQSNSHWSALGPTHKYGTLTRVSLSVSLVQEYIKHNSIKLNYIIFN